MLDRGRPDQLRTAENIVAQNLNRYRAEFRLFALHGAPDLALTQLLTETIVMVLFMLVLRRVRRTVQSEDEGEGIASHPDDDHG